MGNPVKMVDPDGREATSEFEKWLQQAENYAAKKLKDPSISDKERREYESVFTEADKLRNSDQLYHVAYDDLSKSEYKRYGDKNDYPALTIYKSDFEYKGKKEVVLRS